MTFGIKLKVSGYYACFTRPEMKAERVSYDVITPSAARGVLEAIYWKPGIRWVVDQLRVLNEIRFTGLRRNEVGSKASSRTVKTAMNNGLPGPQLFIEDDRQQRASLLLRDVAYIIAAHFEVDDPNGGPPGKHRDMFQRRAARGQCFYQPFLGCREFPAYFETAEDHPPIHPSLRGERDLGWMLHDLDFEDGLTPRFFKASMRDGLIRVPPLQGRGARP